MSEHVDKLRVAAEDAEAKAIALQNDKDQALDKIRDRFRTRQQAANDRAAAAQKAWLDAEAADALAAREDIDDATKQGLASALGLELP